MSFWLREIVGWLMVAAGLFVFGICYQLIRDHYVIEAGPLSVIGIVLFRGGIHLLKVAVAARICREARNRAVEQRPVQAARPRRPLNGVNPLAGRGP